MATTWNPSDKGANVILSNGDLTMASSTGATNGSVRANKGVSSGKWYWEIKFISGSSVMVGVGNTLASLTSLSYTTNNIRLYYINGAKYPGGAAYGAAYTVNDVIGVALDMDVGTLTFYKNGVSQGIAFTDIKTIGLPIYPYQSSGSSTAPYSVTANFGATTFAYTIPDGYTSLSEATTEVTEPTILLLHMDGVNDGTSFIDECGKIVSRVGDVCTKTAQKKFGTASAYFDGVGDYLNIGASADFAFGGQDFTIDGWIYPTSSYENYGGIFSTVHSSSGCGIMIRVSGLNIQCLIGTSVALFTLPVYLLPSANNWYHIAIVRFGNTLCLYVDGILKSSIGCEGMTLVSAVPIIGSSYVNLFDYLFAGYIDEIHVVKGIAQWTANFTVPTTPYSLIPIESRAYCFVVS